MAVHAKEAAKYLAKLSGYQLSNLELQKMIYLADMAFTGSHKERLVDESFEAWDYGPVLPTVYHSCKAFGANPVQNVFWGVSDIEGTEEAEALKTAYEALKDMTPGQLVQNTHWSGGAWYKRYSPGAKGIKITTEDMIEEYERRVRKNDG